MDQLEKDLFFEFAAEHAHIKRHNRIKRSTGNASTYYQKNGGTQKEHDPRNTKTASKSTKIQSIYCSSHILQYGK